MLEKTAMFSEKQVVTLTGFSRKRLYNLSISKIVQPRKDPILYTWNQVIFLRVLYLLREDWSLQVLEKSLKLFAYHQIERIIKDIDTSTAIILFSESKDDLQFKMLGNITFDDDDLSNYAFQKALESIREGKVIDNAEKINAIISYIIGDDQKINGSKISIYKQTIIIIPELIGELKKVADGLNIEYFDLKAG
ncbi:MAG TPA: hypothetical protein VE956_04035 [Nodularia sp. (in: cyanobacteria)]|nr:hypothetical protein [Nodularia sp. (in: cyanobacteria)]